MEVEQNPDIDRGGKAGALGAMSGARGAPSAQTSIADRIGDLAASIVSAVGGENC